MARIAFTPNLQRHLPCPPREAEGETVRAVLETVFGANPRLRSYLLDDQGRLRRHVVVYVNDRPVADRARLSDPVAHTDEVFVFQALSGG
jgi:molybdopterin synthase sulfur carrier subunit